MSSSLFTRKYLASNSPLRIGAGVRRFDFSTGKFLSHLDLNVPDDDDDDDDDDDEEYLNKQHSIPMNISKESEFTSNASKYTPYKVVLYSLLPINLVMSKNTHTLS